MTMSATTTTTAPTNKLWMDLVQWVNNSATTTTTTTTDRTSCDDVGGYVHPSLILKDDEEEEEGDDDDKSSSSPSISSSASASSSSSRGVFAKTDIKKGELLIRIPSYLIISGNEDESGSNNNGVMNNGNESSKTATAAADTDTDAASQWLKCIGAFILTKITAEENNNYKTPYLNSLPKFEEYETIHNWSTKNDIEPFLKGTTLGGLILHDRNNNITKIQYQNSIQPYLIKNKLILKESYDDVEKKKKNDDQINYELFLEASMCISTRGFHVLSTTDTNTDTAHNDDNDKNSIYYKNSNSIYNGPFLLPVIDLLNHNPDMSSTSLQRIKTKIKCKDNTNKTNNITYFTMIAERNIIKDEEIFHSYGTDLTSSQLLQTFGFVPIMYTQRIWGCVVAAAEIEIDQTTDDGNEVKSSTNNTSCFFITTPVSLKKEKHLIAATKHIKSATSLSSLSSSSSSYPDKLQKQIQKQKQLSENDNDDEDDEDDEDDLYWDVHDVPTRLMNELIIIPNDEFLIPSCSSSSGESNGNNNNNGGPLFLSLLTEDMITLLAVQFLPEEAYKEIFPSPTPLPSSTSSSNNDEKTDHDETETETETDDNSSIRFDRSILLNDYYLGMLVCYSLIIAIQIKSKEYNGDDDDDDDTTKADDDDDDDDDNTSAEVLLIGRSLVTMCQQERDKIQTILHMNKQLQQTQTQTQTSQQRELYGRTIRLEEMINLYKFYIEIQNLINTIQSQQQQQQSLNYKNSNDNDGDGDSPPCVHQLPTQQQQEQEQQPPNKKAKVILD